MKKLMIFMTGVVMMALTSSAATLQWGTTGGGVPIANATGTGLTTAYDVLLVWDTTGDGLGLTKDIGTGLVTLGTNITPIDTTRAIGATAGRTGGFTQDYAAFSYNSTYKLYIVAFDGTDWTHASNFATTSKNVTFPTSSTVVPGASFVLTSAGQRIVSSDWGAITPVPEPTSLALLAIGVGAVALRRKFMCK